MHFSLRDLTLFKFLKIINIFSFDFKMYFMMPVNICILSQKWWSYALRKTQRNSLDSITRDACLVCNFCMQSFRHTNLWEFTSVTRLGAIYWDLWTANGVEWRSIRCICWWHKDASDTNLYSICNWIIIGKAADIQNYKHMWVYVSVFVGLLNHGRQNHQSA